jgi:superfamily II DNA or RNA helicase
MLINNWQQLSSFSGHKFVWDYVILDEAHKIKSSSTKSAICARAVPARHRLLLTGTPIQNNLQELWSLFDFACQGSLLGTLRTFKIEYENPIIRAREKDATPGEKALGFKISENLMAIIKPYFLRRTKEEVQKKKSSSPEVRASEKNAGVDATCEMPALSRKNDLIIWIRLVPLQEEIYRKFTSLDHIKELLMETRSPLAELGILKKLCDHPRLLSARVCHLLNLGTASFSDQDGNEQEDSPELDNIDHITDDALMKESGKMIFLMDLLKRLREEGHQTLVFSQSRQILNIIERLLKNRYFKTLRIDGTVTHLWEREKRIQLFQQNKDYSVFLLTTLVGGVGLTLTAATRVVIFDPSWNPTTDAQAVDRVYRIGQKENVVVYRLITCGTVEEKIYRRQVFKDSLIRQTTGDKKNPFRYFSKQELRELFTIEDLQQSATQLQLESLHAAQRQYDEKLDEHVAYLHSLGIAGISDHDLMYTRDLSVKEELDVLDESQYIQHRVQKAQFLVEFESQNTMEKQSTENEGSWLRAPVFPSQTKKKCSELKKPQPQPSHLLATHSSQEDLSSQMASISIDDHARESCNLSSSTMNTTVLQDSSRHSHENTFDADAVTTLPKGFGSIERIWNESLLGRAKSFATENKSVQKKALEEGPKQEALQENPQGSFNCSLSQSYRAEADLGPNLRVQHSEILHHSNPLPITPVTNESKSAESNVSVIKISDDLSASHSALQGAQVNEAKLEKELLASSPAYACDFNLFLEDSADNRQNLSSQSLEHVEKENSLCGFAANSRAESAHHPSLDAVNKDEAEEVIVHVKARSKARRILSDDEGDSCKDTSDTSPFSTSPFQFLSVKQFDTSTPQNNTSPSGRFFSPKIPERVNDTSPSGRFFSPKIPERVNDTSLSGWFFSPKIPDSVNKTTNSRRSLASRRSLINVVLDHVEDMEERLDTSREVEGVDNYPEGEESSSDEASERTEEDPPRETSSPENKSSALTLSEPSSLALQTCAGASEPVCDEPVANSPQNNAVEAANSYETLVTRGRELKECGKIQEALKCLVKALDIKSADPEVMLMTLSLYKQLNNT